MTGVRVYRSKFSGEEIDVAIMNALMFDPQENGWIHVSSDETNPISLGDLITPGNYIVDYFTDGPKSLEGYSPVNVSVYEDNGILTQFIVVLNNVYYRFVDEMTGIYEDTWRMRKTTNSFYINEEPAEPGNDTIKIMPDDNGEYVMSWWNGEKWAEITFPDVMRQSVYDPQGRSTDFFKYTDELFQQMTSTSVGMVLDETDITNNWFGEVSCIRTDSLGTTVIAFKKSSKLLTVDAEGNTDIIDMPVSFNNPQIMGTISNNNEIDINLGSIMRTIYYVYDANQTYDGVYDSSSGAFVGTTYPIYEYDTYKKEWSIKYKGVSSTNNVAFVLLGTQVGMITENSDCAVTIMNRRAAGIIEYHAIVINANNPDVRLIRLSSVPAYITDKDLYYKSGKYYQSVFYRGRDGMTPVRTNSEIQPEVGIMSATEVINSIGESDSDLVEIIAQVQWEWINRNDAYVQVPKLTFSAKTTIEGSEEYIVDNIFTYLSEVDYYVAISNFKEFLGDFSGFAISSTGKLDKIDIIYDWESDEYIIDINTVNHVKDPTMSWYGIAYCNASLNFFGVANTDPSSAYLFRSTEEQNILDAISSHLMNGDIHFTAHDRIILGTRETKDNAEVKFNRVTIDNRDYIDKRLAQSIDDTTQLLSDYEKLLEDFTSHINDTRLHTTEEEKAYWDSKANGEHGHNLDGRVKINANQIVEGILSIDRIPRGAKERLTKVDSIEERNKLTIDDVQNGDRVAVKDEDANRENAYVCYTVVNQDLLCHIDEATGEEVLGVDEAFHEDAAGTGVYIDWVNVEHTPTTLAGFGIVDSYTKTETEEEIDKRIKAQSDILEARFLKYDLDELYNTIHDTNDETHIIEEEMADAIEISEQVQIMDDLLILQEERINQMAEDLSEADALVDDLLKKFD